MSGLELPQGKELKDLCQIAEEVLEELCCGDGFYDYDVEGNLLDGRQVEKGRRMAGEAEPNVWDYIQWARAQEMTMAEIKRMPIEAIQRKYLTDILPKARNIIRRRIGAAAPAEVSDGVLDEILALLWQGKLVWWSTLVDHIRQSKNENGGRP